MRKLKANLFYIRTGFKWRKGGKKQMDLQPLYVELERNGDEKQTLLNHNRSQRSKSEPLLKQQVPKQLPEFIFDFPDVEITVLDLQTKMTKYAKDHYTEMLDLDKLFNQNSAGGEFKRINKKLSATMRKFVGILMILTYRCPSLDSTSVNAREFYNFHTKYYLRVYRDVGEVQYGDPVIRDYIAHSTRSMLHTLLESKK